MVIDKQDKLRCLELDSRGYNSREIYDTYYNKRYPDSKYQTFRRQFYLWKRDSRLLADTKTLDAGTYPNFDAHGATVQVNRSGEIVQAWIKQHSAPFDMEELIEAIRESTVPQTISHHHEESLNMLEIPLYDMHFPFSDYQEELSEILYLITKCHYDEINLVIGQDLFHNDDFRGRTSSGRSIEKVDIVEAWNLADEFWYNVIYYSLENANRVKLIYSKGNHDESLAWAFVQRLKALFPELDVDDSMKMRKCIYWKGCFIGVTHAYTKKNNDPKSLRSIFTIEYPDEFSKAKVREIHAGHTHHEEAGDMYGVTVRRLSTAVPTDEWTDDEGYVGAHKRFMLFEYEPNKLRSIHFV